MSGVFYTWITRNLHPPPGKGQGGSLGKTKAPKPQEDSGASWGLGITEAPITVRVLPALPSGVGVAPCADLRRPTLMALRDIRHRFHRPGRMAH